MTRAVWSKGCEGLRDQPLTPNADKHKKGWLRRVVSPIFSLFEQRVPACFLLRVFQPNNHAGSIKYGPGGGVVRRCPDRLTAAGVQARQRPRNFCGLPWVRPFTRKAGLCRSRRQSQFFAGSNQGRIPSLFKAIKSARAGASHSRALGWPPSHGNLTGSVSHSF